MSLLAGGGTYLFSLRGRHIFGGTSISNKEEELNGGRMKEGQRDEDG